jgi:hypothetical protein
MRGSPEFHVARAAVTALDNFGQLPEHAVDHILRFVVKPQSKSKPQDIEVLYGLCEVIAGQKSDGILPFLLRHLYDKRFMDGEKNQGFPIRYAAAWGIVRQIFLNPSLSQELDVTIFAGYAAHSDGRLAGPCLLVLGMVGDRAFPCIEKLRQEGKLNTERSLLFLLGNRIIGATIEKITKELIPPEYPGNMLLKKPYRWQKIRNFLSSLKGQEDVRPTVRCAAYLLLGDRVKDLANCDDIRTGHRATQIPVMTPRTLSGGE